MSAKEEKQAMEDVDEDVCMMAAVLDNKDNKDNKDSKTEKQIFQFELPGEWLAAMVGVVMSVGSVLVTMDPQNPQILRAFRKPTRTAQPVELTDEEREKATARALEVLNVGILLGSGCEVPVAQWKGARVRLDAESNIYYISLAVNDEKADKKAKRVEYEWDEMRRFSQSFETFRVSQPLDHWAVQLPPQYRNRIDADAKSKVEQLVKSTDAQVLRTAMQTIHGYATSIEMPRIDRDGGGRTEGVFVHSVGAFQFLLKLATLVPAALERVPSKCPTKFNVVHGPLLWYIRDQWIGPIIKKMQKTVVHPDKWPKFGWPEGRTPYEYQTQAVNDMLARITTNRHFLWEDVGAGKTSIALMYLAELRKRCMLPKYAIYVLPDSAIASIVEELQLWNFGDHVRVMVPIKNPGKERKAKYGNLLLHSKVPVPFKIILIEHDHVRECFEELEKIGHESFVILDEVQKMLAAKTKRTTVAHRVSKAAWGSMALTGTPVIDSNTYRVAAWLNEIVPFPVTVNNFFVATSMMIRHNVELACELVKQQVEAKWSSPEEYRAYLGLIHPRHGGTNPRPTRAQLKLAIQKCNETIDRALIEEFRRWHEETNHKDRSEEQKTGKPIEAKERTSGQFIVCRDMAHMNWVREQIAPIVGPENVYCIRKGQSLILTDATVASGQVRDYAAVLTTTRMSTGYSLTRLKRILQGVYEMNVATAKQLPGRLQRKGQLAKTVVETTVHTGLMTYLMRNHEYAQNFLAIMESKSA